jgi:hypothetical protein
VKHYDSQRCGFTATDAQPLALSALAGGRRRPVHLHAAAYQHASPTVTTSSPPRGPRACLSGSIQVFSRRGRRIRLPGAPLHLAKRLARRAGRAGRRLALVEPFELVTLGAGRDLAAGLTASLRPPLVGSRQPTADRRGGRNHPAGDPPRRAPGQPDLGRSDRATPRSGSTLRPRSRPKQLADNPIQDSLTSQYMRLSPFTDPRRFDHAASRNSQRTTLSRIPRLPSICACPLSTFPGFREL